MILVVKASFWLSSSCSVLAEQDFKNTQFTTHAPERVGATTNYLGTMATWCSGYVKPCVNLPYLSECRVKKFS